MVELIVIGFAAHRLWAVWHFGEITRRLREWLGRVKDDPRRWWLTRMLAFHCWCEFCTSISAGLVATLLWPGLGWAYVPVYALAAGVVLWAVERGLVVLNVFGMLPQIAQAFLLRASMPTNGAEAERRG